MFAPTSPSFISPHTCSTLPAFAHQLIVSEAFGVLFGWVSSRSVVVHTLARQ